jgi:hypothetical protein
METDITKLAYALAFTFLIPIVGYMIGIAWNKTVGAPQQINRAWTTFCLAVPIIGLVMFAKVDSDLLRRLWSNSRYLVVVCVVVFGLLIPGALITAIVRLWRTSPRQND